MKNKFEKAYYEAMHKDPGNWKGFIYFNRKDPRVLIPKLYPSMGWTLNFANPYSYLSLILIILIIVGFSIFSK